MHRFPASLLDGYRSFMDDRYARESSRYKDLAASGQSPRVMIIACCDSRAAPETIFNAGPGELFVLRNVANMVPTFQPDGGQHGTSAAIEFAVNGVGVTDIVVMGHGRCGGIRAAVSDASPLTNSDFIGSWMRAIKDVTRIVPREEGCNDALHERHIERASIEHSLANLRTFPWIRMKENRKELSLHGVWFDIAMGELHAYDEDEAVWSAISGGEAA